MQARYTAGVWQFEGYGYVPAGTSGVSVMQVFGACASGRNTTLMLHVYGGRLMYYHDEARVVDGDIYDRWFRLNVVHDVDAGMLTVFIDGEERLAVAGHGGYPTSSSGCTRRRTPRATWSRGGGMSRYTPRFERDLNNQWKSKFESCHEAINTCWIIGYTLHRRKDNTII